MQAGIPPYSDEAIAATIAYCEYVYERYGRFPANSVPFRTILAHQAHHLDPAFYDRFYHPEALTEAQRQHQAGGTATEKPDEEKSPTHTAKHVPFRRTLIQACGQLG